MVQPYISIVCVECTSLEDLLVRILHFLDQPINVLSWEKFYIAVDVRNLINWCKTSAKELDYKFMRPSSQIIIDIIVFPLRPFSFR